MFYQENPSIAKQKPVKFDNLLVREARCEIDEYGVNVVLFMLKSMYFNAPVRLLHIIICSYAFFSLGVYSRVNYVG